MTVCGFNRERRLGLILTVPGGCGFDLEIIADSGSVLVLSFMGAGWSRFTKFSPSRNNSEQQFNSTVKNYIIFSVFTHFQQPCPHMYDVFRRTHPFFPLKGSTNSLISLILCTRSADADLCPAGSRMVYEFQAAQKELQN